jgi:enoyl-[acyl-carrier protein] reductase I
MDFLIHAIAFSDKSELTGRFINTSRAEFQNLAGNQLLYSFIDVAAARRNSCRRRLACDADLWGSNRVTPFYNVMGVAKAALEAGALPGQ